MVSKRQPRWIPLLALVLAGCASTLPTSRTGSVPGEPVTLPISAAEKTDEQSYQPGTVYLRIQWPQRKGRSAQSIPTQTDTLVVTIRTGTKLVDSTTIPRPEGTAPVSDLVFHLDPALKTVDVFIDAKANGAVLAHSERLGVPVRDNTSTGVSVTLNDTGVDARVARQLGLVKDLQHYLDRYRYLTDGTYANSQDAKDLVAAVQSIVGSLAVPSTSVTLVTGPTVSGPALQGYPAFYRLAPTAAYRIQADPTLEHLVSPDGRNAMDLLGNLLKTFYWPGYQGSLTYAADANGRHALDIAVTPDATSSELHRGSLHAELTATKWLATSSLDVEISGRIDGQDATRSVVLLGGEVPDLAAIQGGKIAVGLDPGGNALKHWGAAAGVDSVQDVSASALWQLLTGYYASSLPAGVPSRAPMHAWFTATAPVAQATADLRLHDSLLGGDLGLETRVQDGSGDWGRYVIKLTGEGSLAVSSGGLALQAGDLGFSIEDRGEQLRAEGSIHVAVSPDVVALHLKFVDMPSGKVIATVDYEPILVNHAIDFNHLAGWPQLVLSDGTVYRLTPGYFSGDPTGALQVNVQ